MKKIITIMLAVMVITSLSVLPSFAKNGNSAGKDYEDSLKKSENSGVVVTSNEMNNDNEVNEAYQRVEDEENYIVSLINSLSDKKIHPMRRSKTLL